MKEGNFLRHNAIPEPKERFLSTYGTCAVYNKDFKEVNGYEEAFVGWGYEDTSFYTSLRALGLTDNYFINSGQEIIHDDAERSQYLHGEIMQSNKSNRRISEILRTRHKYKNNINRNWGIC
jgi:hypothetical protein